MDIDNVFIIKPINNKYVAHDTVICLLSLPVHFVHVGMKCTETQ